MLLDHHRAKIVSIPALASMLGRYEDRQRKVVLCHGVFDVLHPGHHRHLAYARSKADLLVCSITSDRCANRKGPNRPHVPEEMRAACLTMLDIVDYVVVCDSPDPLALIAFLQPDFYAKGFEYSPEAGAQTIPEAAIVEAYGGEVLFTPGDFVRSSTALISMAAPDLRYDKLAQVMQQAALKFVDLRSVLAEMRKRRVHVVGDVIVDALLYCDMMGWNGKTPTPSVRRGRREEFVGGAGIVARHAKAAGADVYFSTVVGDDPAGELVATTLADAGVKTVGIVDQTRPTTVKEVVVVGGNYRVLKMDTVDSSPISPQIESQLMACVANYSPRGSATLFSDFRHGVFNGRTIPALSAAIPQGSLRVADSQVASRWGNVSDFLDFDLLTPNEREARFALGDQDSGVRPLAARLRETARASHVLMKMGPRGVLGFGPNDASLALDAFAGPVRDPVGAGDAFLAYSSLALLVRPSLAAAAILGSFAAGAACEYEGNIPVTAEAVMAKMDEAEREIG